VLDCCSGFWQINILEKCKDLTGLTVPSGHYEFNRFLFGLSSSTANFQRLIDSVLKDLVGTDCFIYIDDLILFSKTAEKDAERLKRVLEKFDRANLQLHPGKCVITQTEVKYLGYVLTEKGFSAFSDKVDAVKNHSTHRNAKNVREFWGLASFYHRLVKNFS
jgi:hypothetical protein